MSDYREILASYSVPEPMDPDSLSRRRFLGYVAAGAGAANVGPMLGDGLLSAGGRQGRDPHRCRGQPVRRCPRGGHARRWQ